MMSRHATFIGRAKEMGAKGSGKFHKDLTGKTFGKLTVVAFIGVTTFGKEGKTKKAMWKTQCMCGKEVIANTATLQNEHTTSCGSCSRLKPEGEASFNSVYREYKYHAGLKGLCFLLTKEEFKNLTRRVCHYCGVVPQQVANCGKKSTAYVYNGVDRKDNTQGYTEENSVPCCKVCNMAKRNMSLSQFMDWIKRLIAFNTNLKVMPSASEQD
jgi:hypothetical protein